MPPSQLPSGASPNCQDVIFPEACVRSRPRLFSFFPSLGGNPTINGIKTYANALANIMLAWDSLGNLWQEATPGNLTLIQGGGTSGLFFNSTTLFGREYMAFFDGKSGRDIPRQFDGTNYDRVSQTGPGAAPTPSNFLPIPAVVQNTGAANNQNIVATPNGIVWGGLVTFGPNNTPFWSFFTVTTTAPHGFTVGQRVVIAGSASTPGVNQTWTIASIPTNTTFTVNNFAYQPSAVNGGNGTASVPANDLVRTSGTVLITTAAAHTFQPGFTVQISGFANVAVGGGISAISQAGGIATCTTATAHGLVPGAAAIITGTANYNSSATGWIVTSTPSPTSFTFAFSLNVAAEAAGAVATPLNGTFTILTVPTATTFTYAQLGPDEASNTVGAATVIGNVTAGLHNIALAFITRQGFITCPSPPAAFYAAGSELIALAQVAIGPPNVIARLIVVTPVITPPATTGPFYSVPSVMQISDNTSTAAIIDFSDAVLISSFNAQYLFAQVELGECASVNSYNSRTVWTGERNKVKADGGGGGFNNLTFDGGFQVQTPGIFPLGWTADGNVALATGGGQASVLGMPVYWGDAYTIIGDGIAAVRGKMSQTAARDYLNNPILAANTTFSIRARIARNAALVQGTLHINLQSTSAGYSSGLQVTAAQSGLIYAEFSAAFLSLPQPLPSDLVLQIFVDGTPTATGVFVVDCIEIFPTKTPVNLSSARISHANNPESFDGLLDLVQIAAPGASAGIQMLRASWQIRTNLYLAKDHYLCYVSDDGQNEPSFWAITEVSNTIGCCGPNAWDGTEEWVIFAERSGAYITGGSDPVKVMQEIQEDVSATGKPNWNATNWLLGHTIWTRIDRLSKRVLIGLPVTEGFGPTIVFQMDYKFSPTGEAIIGAQAPSYSAFSGRILVHGSARKWAPWNVRAYSCALIERPDGTSQVFMGSGLNNGKIYELVDAATQGSDDGTAVNDFYETYGQPSKNEEEALQLGQHRKICEYLTGVVTGSGLLSIQAISPYRTTAIRAVTLAATQTPDFERNVSIHGERIRWRVGTNAIGNYFQLERLIASMKADPVIPVRGLSA